MQVNYSRFFLSGGWDRAAHSKGRINPSLAAIRASDALSISNLIPFKARLFATDTCRVVRFFLSTSGSLAASDYCAARSLPVMTVAERLWRGNARSGEGRDQPRPGRTVPGPRMNRQTTFKNQQVRTAENTLKRTGRRFHGGLFNIPFVVIYLTIP